MERKAIASLTEIKFENIVGDTLKLNEIISSKKITLIKISYLTKKKPVRAKGIKGFFGVKTLQQKQKRLIISDTNGITLKVNQETGTVIARFSRKKEFEKISELDLDETTLRYSYVMSFNHPYSIVFHIQNLQQVFWENY